MAPAKCGGKISYKREGGGVQVQRSFLKIALFAPMPRARVSSATAVKRGFSPVGGSGAEVSHIADFQFPISGESKHKIPNPKYQTVHQSRSPEFGVWSMEIEPSLGFGPWSLLLEVSLVFGAWILEFPSAWFWSFHSVDAPDSFNLMSPELARRFNTGPPPLSLPRKTPGFCAPVTVIEMGIVVTTFPPLVSASRSTATERGRVSLMSPPETSR